jgi:LysR family transcriptional regulator, regulator for bpeEF and oprC
MSQQRHGLSNLSAISVFVRIGETRSLTVAAQRLGMSPSGVSKALARLEERLAVRLVNRTTHSVSLTEEGAHYFARCRQILAELEEAEATVTRARATPRGRLKVQMPPGFGRKVVVPALAGFIERYPELRVDVELSDRPIDMAEESVDVVLRVGEPPDQRLITKKLWQMQYLICASPEYLRHHGEPRSPQDLAQHRCLTLVRPHSGRYRDWSIFRAPGDPPFEVIGALAINDIQALVDAAIAGTGILYASSYMVWDAIRDGKLKVVLPERIVRGPPLNAFYLPNRHLAPRIRAFLDFLGHLVPPAPPWEAAQSFLGTQINADAALRSAAHR